MLNSLKAGHNIMTRITTTKATHRGVKIVVVADSSGHGTTYSCTNDVNKTKLTPKWFATQGDAIANERQEIDAVMPYGETAIP